MSSQTQHHHHHHHNHAHHAHHDNIDSDYGAMYEMDWVKELLSHIQRCLQSNSSWFGLEGDEPCRVLDYACGDGIVSRSLMAQNPNAVFRGIDLSAPQIGRFNREAERALGHEHHHRLEAIQGDIMNPSTALDQAEWHDFDFAIVSMALHHMQDPIRFLSTLKQRVRRGGTIVVIDWLQDDVLRQDEPSTSKYDPEGMITVPDGNLKIWSGFSMKGIQEDLKAAGCGETDVVVYPEHINVPGAMEGHSKIFIAKAEVI